VLVPFELVHAGLAPAEHWKMYAMVMGCAGVLMLLALRGAQRRGRERAIFLLSIALVLIGQASLLPTPTVVGMGVALLVFFTGFLVLEAALPAQVSRVAPPEARGSAIAIYSTVQFLGASCGGALGGYLLQHLDKAGLVWANVGLTALWLAVASRQRGFRARSLTRASSSGTYRT
jgi:predicted MFS family arabinose efflux permease